MRVGASPFVIVILLFLLSKYRLAMPVVIPVYATEKATKHGCDIALPFPHQIWSITDFVKLGTSSPYVSPLPDG